MNEDVENVVVLLIFVGIGYFIYKEIKGGHMQQTLFGGVGQTSTASAQALPSGFPIDTGTGNDIATNQQLSDLVNGPNE